MMKLETYKFKEKIILSQTYKDICLANERIIENNEIVFPLCFVINDYELDVLTLSGNWNKDRRDLFRFLSSKKFQSYIIVAECGTYLHRDIAVTRNFYSKDLFGKSIVYKKGNTIYNREFSKDRNSDFWDYFNYEEQIVK